MSTIQEQYKAKALERAVAQGYELVSAVTYPFEENSHAMMLSTGKMVEWSHFLNEDEMQTLQALEVPSDSTEEMVFQARRKAWAAYEPREPDAYRPGQPWPRVAGPECATYSFIGLGLQVMIDNVPVLEPSDVIPWTAVDAPAPDGSICQGVDDATELLCGYYGLSVEYADRLWDLAEEGVADREHMNWAILNAPSLEPVV